MKWERAPGTPPRSFAITLTTVANRPLQSSRRGHFDRVTPGLAPPHRPKKGLKGHAFIDEECVGRQAMSMNAIRFPLLTRKSIQLGTALLCTSAPACDMGRESKVSDTTESQEGEDTGDPMPPELGLHLHTWWESAGEAAALDTLTTLFRESHPKVNIQVTTVPGGPIGSLYDLYTRVATGALPDVFLLMSPEVKAWSQYVALPNPTPINLLVPLDDLMAETGADEQIPPAILDLNRVLGGTYAAPIAIHRHNTLFYNKSLLSDVGAEVPTSLSGFESLCAAVEVYNADRPAAEHIVAMATIPEGFALDLIFQTALVASANELSPGSGGQYLTDFFDGKKSVEDPEYQNAVRFMNTVFRCSNQPKSITQHVCSGGDDDAGPCTQDSDTSEIVLWTDSARLLQDERAVTFLHGDWTKSEYDAAAFKDYGLAPAFGTDGTFIFSLANLAAFAQSPNPENALKFVRRTLEAEEQTRFAAKKGAIPPRLDAPLDALDALAQKTTIEFRTASTLQDTETIRGWLIWEPLLEFWRARHRDGYAASGAQFDADVADFTASTAWAYEQFKKNPTGAYSF